MIDFFNKWMTRLHKVIFIGSYYLFHHRRMIKKLSSYGMSEIKTQNIKQWLRIIRSKKIIRHFYKAKFDGKVCFVKLGRKGMFMDNEITLNKYINQFNFTFIPKLLISDDNFDNDKAMIVIEFFPEARRFELPEDKESFESVCSQFEHIHSCFLEIGLIHGDLTPANVLINKENQVQIIDFGVAWIPKFDVIEMTRAYGRNYLLSKNSLVYDNVYAFLKLLESVGISDEYKTTKSYQDLQSLVGKHTKIFRGTFFTPK
ncbi:MAG: hypothetical protein FWD05_04045 [Oscillospiraceae bacterium]|nr:hypothetical protein [Oscillospiraceae bacterium]